jgi:two-component system, NtrC family, response regulator AtoC
MAAGLELLVYQGESVAVFPLPEGGTVRIGRGPENEIRIPHASVSRAHAAVHLGTSLELEDLGGSNGTFVGPPHGGPGEEEASATADTRGLLAVRRTRVRVAVGDCIHIGSAVLVLRRRSPPEAAEPLGARAPGAATIVDPAMVALYEQAELAAQGTISILILGETGVGKEVLARTIHRWSPRAKGPFLALNCGAISESLLESELFGHEKGAFTGAAAARAGLLESASGGTVFLDEVGELVPATQVKLLRVLEDRKVMRVGGRAEIGVDIRFVAATNREIDVADERASFRRDLYYRLGGVTLTIPPLRERGADLASLARRFIDEVCAQMDRKQAPVLSDGALALMRAYAWPGNVRELRNAMERAVLLCRAPQILPEHLPAKMLAPRESTVPRPPPAASAAPPAPAGGSLKDEIGLLEKQRILDALDSCGNNQTRAASLLGISRRTLINRIEEYGLVRPRRR